MRKLLKPNGVEGDKYGDLTILSKKLGSEFFALHSSDKLVSAELDILVTGDYTNSPKRLVGGNPYLSYSDGTTEVYVINGQRFLMDTCVFERNRDFTYNIRKLKDGGIVTVSSRGNVILSNYLLNRAKVVVKYRNGNTLDLRLKNLYISENERGDIIPADILNGEAEDKVIKKVTESKFSKTSGLDLLNSKRGSSYNYPVSKSNYDTKPLVLFKDDLIQPTGYEGYTFGRDTIISQYKESYYFVRVESVDGYRMKLLDLREFNNTYKIYIDIPHRSELPVLHLKDGTSIVFDEYCHPIKIQSSSYISIKNGKIIVTKSGFLVIHTVRYNGGRSETLMNALGYKGDCTFRTNDIYDYRESNIIFN